MWFVNYWEKIQQLQKRRYAIAFEDTARDTSIRQFLSQLPEPPSANDLFERSYAIEPPQRRRKPGAAASSYQPAKKPQ